MPSEETAQSRDWNMTGPQYMCVKKHSMNKNQTKAPETGTDGAGEREPEKKTGELKTSNQPRTRADERKTEMAEKKAGRRRERGGIEGESR